MKSLRNFESKYLTAEIIEYIKSEGFEHHGNDSYCFKETDLEWVDFCYFKHIDECQTFCINVYIFDNMIGVDVDYNCGGNLATYTWKFVHYDFEKAYDHMVDIVKRYVSQ